MTSPLAAANGASVYHATWQELLDVVPECNALIVDAPYSERTHNGHGTMERWGHGVPPSYDGGDRREIVYSHWTPADVNEFVAAWAHRCSGWFVSITDHSLRPAWSEALESEGRYVFAPLPFVAPGSRVRLAGDGPSCWSTDIVVARPRSRAFAKWGTLPGAYVLPPGEGGAMPVVGGKPLWLMRALARDYSRPGDLIVDPCCGAGTTLVGAIREGRRAIGGDCNPEHAAMAAKWIGEAWAPTPAAAERQPSLFGATP